MDEKVRAYIDQNPAAAMITLRADGTPHAVRVGLGVIEDKLWSSGTQDRVRTRQLRRDPRCTLFIYGSSPGDYTYLTLECTVAILDGPDAPQENLQLFQAMQSRLPQPPPEGQLQWFGQNLTFEDFLDKMTEEQRLIYEFTIERTYGMY
jgi:PPOX class probable F420-dependent enzyme